MEGGFKYNMSKVIDERIVEMRFDNKQFEEGTKKTLSTLARLKEALKFSDSSKSLQALEKTANNIKMDGMVSSLRSLEKRFSTLGIVGMRTIENLTDTMLNKFGGAVRYVQDAVVSGGIRRAMNIENAHFQLQALLKDEEKVQAVMDNAMESVDGTAYAYDEAAKAASMFSASGIQAGEDMMRALKGVTGVAAMTNSEYESISEIFTTVAGNGRLMGDQLLQLSSRGLNAAATIADFFNEVNKGTVQTSDGIKNAIAELTEGVTISEGEIREWVSGGQISFQMFAEAMNNAFGDSAERANETFTGALSNIKSALARIGAEFTSPLVVQNGALVELFNTMRLRINDLKKELTFDESIGNVNALSKQFTDSVIAMAKATNEFVKDADISGPVRILYANVEIVKNLLKGLASVIPPIGKAFSKIFTDFKIDNVADFAEHLAEVTKNFKLTEKGALVVERIFSKIFRTIASLINSFDSFSDSIFHMTYVTKSLRIVNRLFESFINVGSNVLTILESMGKGFLNVFSNGDITFLDQLLNILKDLAMSLMQFTEKLRLSEESAKNLEDGFTGIFSIVKLITDAFIGLLSAILPVEPEMTSIGTTIIEVFGNIGRLLTEFSEWVRQSEAVNAACELVTRAVSGIIEGLIDLIKWAVEAISSLLEFETVTAIFQTLKKVIKTTIQYISPIVDAFGERITVLKDNILGLTGEDVRSGVSFIGELFKAFADNLTAVDLAHPSTILESFTNGLKGMIDLARTNPGFDTFVQNVLDFIDRLTKGLSSQNVAEKVDGVKGGFSTFTDWIKDTFLPMLQNLSAGDVLGAGMSFAGIYSFIKAVKAFSSIGSAADSFKSIIEKVGNVLDTYQKNIKATILLKIAAAIGILAASLVLLSFADTEGMISGAKAIAIIAGIVGAAMIVITKMTKDVSGAEEGARGVKNVGDLISDAIKNFINGHLDNTSKITKVLLSVGITMGAIAASISSLAKTYQKNEDGFNSATKTILTIVGVFGGLMAAITILSKVVKGDGNGFSDTSKGIRNMASALLLSVFALNKIFKMKLPDDWKTKLAILSGIFAGLSALAIVMTLIGRISGGNEGPGKTVLLMAVSLLPVISALNKLFKMELPGDWKEKLAILATLFGMLSVTMIAVGIAGRIAGGNLKAGSTILAMAAFIGSIVSALSILSLIKEDNLMKGVKTIDLVLLGLAVTLSQAGKIHDKGAGEAVRAMASVVTSITGSLIILGMIEWEKLKKGVVSLDAVLLGLAATFSQIGKIKNDNAFLSVFAMVAMVISIAAILNKLSEQPWEGMIASGISMTAALLGVSQVFKQLSSLEDDGASLKTIGKFLALTTAVIPIGAALFILSEQPWEGMIAAGAAMSITILAFSEAFKIIAKAEDIDRKVILSFLSLTIALLPIGAALFILSEQPWDGMLAAAASISLTLLAFSAVTAILSKIGNAGTVKAALYGVAALDILIADIGLVIAAIGALMQIDGAKQIMEDGGKALSSLGNSLGDFFGEIIGGFIGGIGKGIESIGTSMTNFMDNAKGFFDNIASLGPDTVDSAKILAESVLDFLKAASTAKVLNDEDLKSFADQLPPAGEAIKNFADKVKDIDPKSVEGAAAATEIIANMAKNLPYSMDSLMGKILGKKSLSAFAIELTTFAPSIVVFANTVKGVEAKSVKGAAAAATLMSDFAKGLTYDPDSFAGKIFGRKSLTIFGEELVSFGPKIVKFSNKVSDVNQKSVKGAAAAATIMSEVANKLPAADDTLVAKIFGSKSLSEFGAELKEFGPSIKDFAEDVSGVKEKSVKGAAAVSEIFVNIAKAIPKEGGFFSLFTGNNSIDKFGEKLVKFGEKFKDFCDKIAAIKSESVEETSGKIGDLVKVLRKTGENGVTAFIEAFTKKESEISKAIDKMIDFAIDKIQNKDSTFTKAGTSSRIAYANGIKNEDDKKALDEAGKFVVKVVVDAIEASAETMKTAGVNLAQGFIDGIMSKQQDASNAGTALGNAAYEAAKRALDEHSPSLKMRQVGLFAALGLINELMKNVPKAYEAGEELGLSTLEGVEDSTTKLVNYIDSNWNLDPIVRPSLDLSEIKDGGNEINKMFNDSIDSVRLNANGVNRSVRQYSNPNAGQTELINAINELKDALPKIGGGDSYNINGISYQENSDIARAIQTLVRATNVKRRV